MPLFWDKRATARRDPPDGTRLRGARLVYLGLAPAAAKTGAEEPSGLRVGEAVEIAPGAVATIGRSELCELTVRAAEIAPVHALVTLAPGEDPELTVVDLDAPDEPARGKRGPVYRLAPGEELVLAGAFRWRWQPVLAERKKG
jgi:hypothetical protein